MKDGEPPEASPGHLFIAVSGGTLETAGTLATAIRHHLPGDFIADAGRQDAPDAGQVVVQYGDSEHLEAALRLLSSLERDIEGVRFRLKSGGRAPITVQVGK